jgi:hypothetical protein
VNEARHFRVDLRVGSIWQLCHVQETQDMGTVRGDVRVVVA